MATLIDISGQRFGLLTAIKVVKTPASKNNTMWLCKCDCGNEKAISGAALRNGRTVSCGCITQDLRSAALLDDLTGKRFGSWTVLRRGKTTKHREVKWVCQCDCGTIAEVNGAILRRGESKSCGCKTNDYLRETMKANGRTQGKHRITPSLSETPSYDEMLSLFEDEYKQNDCNLSLQDYAFRKMFQAYWQQRIRRELGSVKHFEKPNRCEMCNEETDLELHHIQPVRKFGGNEPENIAWLCRSCHLAIEGKQCKG